MRNRKIKQAYRMFMYLTLEERAAKSGMSPEFIDDMYVGLVGFPSGHPFAQFTEAHGIKFNPDNMEGILLELSQLLMHQYSIRKFMKRKMSKRRFYALAAERLSIPVEQRILNIKKILADNYDWSKALKY